MEQVNWSSQFHVLHTITDCMQEVWTTKVFSSDCVELLLDQFTHINNVAMILCDIIFMEVWGVLCIELWLCL